MHASHLMRKQPVCLLSIVQLLFDANWPALRHYSLRASCMLVSVDACGRRERVPRSYRLASFITPSLPSDASMI